MPTAQLQKVTPWSLYYKYKHFRKMEKRKKKNFMLILAVSIMHENARGDKLTQHSALQAHTAGLHSSQLLCGSSGALPSLKGIALKTLSFLTTSFSTAWTRAEPVMLTALLAPRLQSQLEAMVPCWSGGHLRTLNFSSALLLLLFSHITDEKTA